MNCNEARDLLSAKLDGELSPAELATLEEHIKTCSECQAILKAYQDLDSNFIQLVEPPASLRESVMDTIRREKVVKFPKKRWAFGPGTAMAAVAALLVLIMGGYIPGFDGLAMGASDSAKTESAVASMEDKNISAPASPMLRETELMAAPTEMEESIPEAAAAAPVLEEATEESAPESAVYMDAPAESTPDSEMEQAETQDSAPENPYRITLELAASEIPELSEFPVEFENGNYFCTVPGELAQKLVENPAYHLSQTIDSSQTYQIICIAP